MARLKLILVFIIIFALLTSCGSASSSEQDQLVETRVALGIAQTQLAQTETAMAPQITQIPVGVTPLPSGTSVTVTVSLATNCRTGPSDIYPTVGGLQVGEVAEVVGKDAYDQYWIIILPSDPQVTCWLWGQYATIIGDASKVAVVVAPPTPVPTLQSTNPVSTCTVCTITIYNNCTRLYYIFVKSSNSPLWGCNITGPGTIYHGASYSFTVASGIYDISACGDHGDSCTIADEEYAWNDLVVNTDTYLTACP